MDQSVVDFWTVAGGMGTIIGSIFIAGIGLFLRERYLKAKLKVEIKPIWIIARSEVSETVLESKFDYKFPQMQRMPNNLELMTLTIHNPRSYAVRVNGVGIILDEGPTKKWWRPLSTKREVLKNGIRKSTDFTATKWDHYDGGSLEIPGYSTLEFAFNIWPHLEGIIESGSFKFPVVLRGYASILGRASLSSMSQGYTLTGNSRSFSTKETLPGLRFYLLRYLSVFANEPISVVELNTVIDLIVTRLKTSYIDEITYGDISQAQVIDFRDANSIVGYHLSEIVENHYETLRLPAYKVGGIILELAERGLVEPDLVHEDFLGNKSEIVGKAQIKMMGDFAPSVLIVKD